MKKLISLLLCFALALGGLSALAEAPEKSYMATVSGNGRFDLQCAVPEGYDLEVLSSSELMVRAALTMEDAAKPTMTIILAFDENYADVERMNDLSGEELAHIGASFSEYDVEITYTETAYGTKLMCVREKGDEEDFIAIITLYKGYMIEFDLLPGEKSDGTLTQSQFDTAVQFLSDMDFIAVEEDAAISGGWYINDEIAAVTVTGEEQAIFDAAMAESGLDCQAVALLATQVVAGTNYAFLTKEKSSSDWAVITVYRDLGGNAQVIGVHVMTLDNLLLGDTLELGLAGGWQLKENIAAALPENAQAAFDEAASELDLTPIALLGTQLVAGMNYMVLAVGDGTLCVAVIYQPLEGLAEMTGADPLDLLSYVGPPAE